MDMSPSLSEPLLVALVAEMLLLSQRVVRTEWFVSFPISFSILARRAQETGETRP